MRQSFFTTLAAFAIALSALAHSGSPAAAGGDRVFQFGGPLPSFKATRHGGSSKHYGASKSAYSQKQKLRKRAAAKAKAYAVAKAKAKAKARSDPKRKAIARAKAAERRKAVAAAKARKRAHEKKKALAQSKAARKRVAVRNATAEDKASDVTAAETESAFTNAPSTAALITKNDISDGADTSSKIETSIVPASGSAFGAQNDAPKDANTVAVKETEKTTEPETKSAKIDTDESENGCKKFIPAVGLTISVDC